MQQAAIIGCTAQTRKAFLFCAFACLLVAAQNPFAGKSLAKTSARHLEAQNAAVKKNVKETAFIDEIRDEDTDADDEDDDEDEDEHEDTDVDEEDDDHLDEDEDEEEEDEDAHTTRASAKSGMAFIENVAGTTLARKHMRVLAEVVEEKLRVAPSNTLSSISKMLSSAQYHGSGTVCMDFSSLGGATTTSTTTTIYDTLPGTYDPAAFTCPPSATNLGELTCTEWGGNMPWKHYLHFSQTQKPQLSLYDCFKLCKMSPGCKYYWWQVSFQTTMKKSHGVCSLIHDTKEHGMAACKANAMMSFPYAGQPSAAVYCPLVLNTREELGSKPLVCAGKSPPTQKDCIYKMKPLTSAAAPVAAS